MRCNPQVKTKQGDGRLIRCETDCGVVAIIDIRAHENGTYHIHVVSALPKCRITSDITEVRDFYVDKKPPAYFLNRR